MKKIMLALAVITIALGAQANYVKWALSTTAGSTYYAGSADLSAFTAYLIQTSDWSGDVADLADKVGSATWATSKDTGSARQYKTASPVTSETTLAAGNYNFYVVLSDGSKYWASEALEATVYEAGSTDPNNKAIAITLSGASAITSSSLQTLSGGGGGGGGTDVPEPTSGLLLVIGGAMLALRRRR